MNEKGHLYLFYSFNGLFNELCSLHNDTLHCDKMKKKFFHYFFRIKNQCKRKFVKLKRQYFEFFFFFFLQIFVFEHSVK